MLAFMHAHITKNENDDHDNDANDDDASRRISFQFFANLRV